MPGLERTVFQIPPSKVYLLKFILEGYDNLFFLSTLEPRRGLVQILSAKGTHGDLVQILQDLSMELGDDGETVS